MPPALRTGRRIARRPQPAADRPRPLTGSLRPSLGPTPSAKTAIFRCVGMSAKRRLAVSAGSFWLGSGRLDNNKKSKFFWRVWAGFLSLAPYLVFGNVLCFGVQQPDFGLSGLALNAEPKSVEFFCCTRRNTPVWRLEERPPFSSGSVVMCLMQYHAV